MDLGHPRHTVSLGYGSLGGASPTWVLVGVAHGWAVLEAWDDRPPRVFRVDLARWLGAHGLEQGEAVGLASSFAKRVELTH